jgi:hypothetical protein
MDRGTHSHTAVGTSAVRDNVRQPRDKALANILAHADRSADLRHELEIDVVDLDLCRRRLPLALLGIVGRGRSIMSCAAGSVCAVAAARRVRPAPNAGRPQCNIEAWSLEPRG